MTEGTQSPESLDIGNAQAKEQARESIEQFRCAVENADVVVVDEPTQHPSDDEGES